MKKKIHLKILDTNNKITNLVDIREGLLSQIKGIDNQITQLVGAVNSLNELLNESDSAIIDSNKEI